MMIPTAQLGRAGERRAVWFYRLRGYRIVGRNVRLRSGEIDLIARRGRTIVIAEVKTRQSLAAGEGYDAVDRAKRERLVRLGGEYVRERRDLQIRYDVVSLFWNGRRFVVSHYPDAFRPVSDARRPWRWRA
ncbi:MAG TPA: YraN family protein [Thermoanaerobaculia bacterium]